MRDLLVIEARLKALLGSQPQEASQNAPAGERFARLTQPQKKPR